MRKLVLKSALMGLLLCGCGQRSAPDVATSASGMNSAGRPDSNEAMPASSGEMDASSSNSPNHLEGQVEVDGIRLTSPSGWESRTAGSAFVAAEFSLPRAGGDDADGRLTISTAGGTVEANIDRWKAQFEPEPRQASREEVDVAGLKVTIVDFSGDFNDQRGPFAPTVKRPAYRMIAAVIPVAGQLHFLKATGPQNTITTHAEGIHKLIRSVQPTE